MEEESNKNVNSNKPGIRKQRNEYPYSNDQEQNENTSNIDRFERSESDPNSSSEDKCRRKNNNSFTDTLNRIIWAPIDSKLQSGRFKTIHYYVMLVLTNITLEPAEFLWSLGGNMGAASVSQLIVDKACNDLGYNETICENVYNYEDIYNEVSKEVCILIF